MKYSRGIYITMRKKQYLENVQEFAKEEQQNPEEAFETELEKNQKEINSRNVLSCGSALLNMACTDSPYGAFIPGRYYLLVGSSSSGKTWLVLNTCAEACINPRFDNYKLILDEPEEGNNVDIQRYFGRRMLERIKAPGYDEDNLPVYSETVEDFYDNLSRELDSAEKDGYGLIYIIDSMDALTSMAEIKKTSEQREAREKGKEAAGSMGDGKAKVNSQNLRRVCARLQKTNSILFIICQERDSIGSMVSYKTFSGGNALLFYATLQIWFSHYQEIKATINKHERTLGNISKISIKKNRLTGQRHKDILLPFYHSFGIDDTGSIIDFLVKEEHWKGDSKDSSPIEATEFGVKLNKEKLARHIEQIEGNRGRKKLYHIVQNVWKKIKQEIGDKVVRKMRYADE